MEGNAPRAWHWIQEAGISLEAFLWQWASRFDSQGSGTDAQGSVLATLECVRVEGPNGPILAM
jgi:hypothetical protein